MASAASSHVDGKRRSVDEATRLREALSRPRRRIAADEIDARVAALYARFPWCAAFLEALRRDVGRRAAMNEGVFGFSPVLLLGPPGSGKSRLAQALAAAFGAPFLRVDRAGESDAREFLGTGAGWSSERPALPTQLLADIDVANPVMFIDEINKETVDSRNGSVSRGLLPMLEPQTARTWRDPFLSAEVDLSQISWILAVNDLTRLRGPLLSRLTIHTIPCPGPAQFDALLDSILRDLTPPSSTGVDGPENPLLLEEARAALRHRFICDRLDARALRRIVEQALAAGQVAMERRALQ